MSAPVGPHGSLLVAVEVSVPIQSERLCLIVPLRTLTCTEEYPFVTFFTERMTDDMLG